MVLLLHILVALGSVGFTTYVFVKPSKGKLHAAYALAGTTVVSGVYLIASNPAHMAKACVVGFVYISVILYTLLAIRHKLALQQD